MRGYLTTIEKVTGHHPGTCPWRAYYEPIVREVIAVAWAIPDGNLPAVLGPDPAFIVGQACGVYKRALDATRADEERLQHEERRAENAARAAARKAGARG